jgi:hypothetical protein
MVLHEAVAGQEVIGYDVVAMRNIERTEQLEREGSSKKHHEQRRSD